MNDADTDGTGFWRHPAGLPLVTCKRHRNNERPLERCPTWPRPPCEVCDLLAFGGSELTTREERRAFEREFFALIRDKAVWMLQESADLIGVIWIGDDGVASTSDAVADAHAITIERWAGGIAGTLQGIVREDNRASGRSPDTAAARLFAQAVGSALRNSLARGFLRPDVPFAPPARVAVVVGVSHASQEIVCSMYPRQRDPETWALALHKLMRAVASQLDGASTLVAMLNCMDRLVREAFAQPGEDAEAQAQASTCGQRPAGIAYDPEHGGTPVYCELPAGHSGDHRNGASGWLTSALEH